MTAPNPPPPAENLSTRRYRRLLTYLKPAKWPFVGGVLAGVIFAITSGLAFPFVLQVVVPVLFDKTKAATAEVRTTPQSPNVPAVAASSSNDMTSVIVTNGGVSAVAPANANLVDEKTKATQKRIERWAYWLFGDDYQDRLLLTACLALPLVFLVRGICSFLSQYLTNFAGFVVLEALRTDVFQRLQQLPLAFFQRHKSGDLSSRLMTDTEQLKNVIVLVSADIIKQPFTLIGALGYLIYKAITNRSAFFVLIGLLGVAICIIPIRIVARRLIKKARLLASQTGELNAVVTEGLQSPMEIQAYNLQPRLLERFTNNIRGIFRLSMKTVKYRSFVNPVIEFISACGFTVALYYGVKHGMDVGVFVAMGGALYMAYEPVKKLSILNAVWKMGAASLERLEQVLDAEDTVPQPALPVPLPAGANEICFEQVGFTYASREPNGAAPAALSDINVRIRPGEVVALVGPSGAGKSTFVALIPRFYDPASGRVTLGGVDVRQADKVALRDRIALVPQKPALFNTTIGENIRMGRLTATDAEVRAAAQKAFIADFIEGLEQGYDSMVGERGTSLSGGQCQRIAIARAFLKDAPVLIMDEATSALDSESEQKVQQALKELVQGRTTFMIAHRFPSISVATRILVFEEGRITGDGTAEELNRTHATFQRMAKLQQLK